MSSVPDNGNQNHAAEPISHMHGPADAATALILVTKLQVDAAVRCSPAGTIIYEVHPNSLSSSTAPDGLNVVFGKKVVIFPGPNAPRSRKVYDEAMSFGQFCTNAGAAEVRYAWLNARLDKQLEGLEIAEQRKRLNLIIDRAAKKPAPRKPDPDPESGKQAPAPKADTPAPRATAPRVTRWTDSGVAERWVDSVSNEWCWTAGSGFRAWDGHVWEHADDAEALESLRQFGKREVVAELDDTASDDTKDAVNRLEAKQLKAALSLAKGQMVEDLAEFDQDPDIAVAPNGVIDLVTGELLPHDPARLVTKCCGIEYVPGATHPDWDQALTSLPSEVADYMQIRFGQALTGYPPDDDVMAILRGRGENAKTTMIAAVRNAFGDYAVLLSDKVLLGDTRDHSTEMMSLRGSRLAYIEELPEARHLNTQRLKKINGSDEVTARYVHKDNITFKATWGLAISTNYEVLVEETDHGTWRRLQEIRFPFTYKKSHEPLTRPTDRHGDPRLRDAVKHGTEQQQAVLVWLVEGAKRWYANNRTMPEPPEQVRADTLAWRKLNDQVLAYCEERLVLDPDSAVWINDLHAEFGEWLRGRGHNAWAMPKMRSRFADCGWLKDANAHFTGRVRRDPREVSRPLDDRPGLSSVKRLPAQGQYLVGIRFRTRSDDLAELDKTGDATDAASTTTDAKRRELANEERREQAIHNLPRLRTELEALEASGARPAEIKLARLLVENAELQAVMPADDMKEAI
ncbi:phage/plasmid primase, P4 family [Brevibacterium sp. K11IcPPYGO002]|uniref:DNA primase family protein n=1 Tax=Brevibacterium sp. K11IcPPYGO002 TaxID=3058837 RepID=UPI003D81A1C0